MSDGAILAIIFSIMIIIMLMGTPIFTSIGITAIIAMLIWMKPTFLARFGMTSYQQATNFNQLIAPMFIMMSEFLSQGHIAEDIYALLNRLVGKLKGGLAISTTLACTIFAALCGSSPATAASIGRLSISEMQKRGYDDAFAVGTVAAGGTLGIMIPPSITFCFYAMITETSVVQLFMAGVLPGLMLATLIIIYILIRGFLNPAIVGVGVKTGADMDMDTAKDIMNAVKAEAGMNAASKAEYGIEKEPGMGRLLVSVLPALALILIVLGSMYLGWATAIEAAGYGVIGSLLIVILTGRMNRKIFSSAMQNTARMGTMMVFLIICGSVLTYVISYLGIASAISEALAASGMGKWTFLILVYILWFILGCLMDPASMVMLTIPFLHQSLMDFGFHSIWVGCVSVLASQIAMITPPVGMNLFVLKANCNVSMGNIMKGCIPYVIVLFIGLAIMTIFPDICLWLPSKVYNIG